MSARKRNLRSITLGVKDDFSEYFKRFESVENVRYERFSKIWREMKLSILWSGRQSEREAREFVEECLRLAIGYWLPPCSFQTQVGALYLIHGLYWTQPSMPRVCIRVLPQEWSDICKFLEQLKAEQHYDAEYVFHKLVHERAFYHVGVPLDVNMRAKDGHEREAMQERMYTPGVSNLIDSTHLDCLAAFHDKYHDYKCQLAGPNATRPETSLDFIHNDLLTSVHSLIAKHKEILLTTNKNITVTSMMKGRSAAEDSDDDADDDEHIQTPTSMKSRAKIGKVRRKIKSKAFKSAANLQESKRGKIQSPERKSHTDKKVIPKLFASDVTVAELEPPQSQAMCQEMYNSLTLMEAMENQYDADTNSSGEEDQLGKDVKTPKKSSGSASSDSSKLTKSPRKRSKSGNKSDSSSRSKKSRVKIGSGSTSDEFTSPKPRKSAKKQTKITSPELLSPKIESPKLKSPEIKSPKIKSPKLKSPKINMKSPRLTAPNIKSPKPKLPKVTFKKQAGRPGRPKKTV